MKTSTTSAIKMIQWVAVGLITTAAYGQSTSNQKFEHTMELKGEHVPPQASIDDVSWLQGLWTCQLFGGEAEEFWTAPMAGSMTSVFRSIANGKVNFYELQTIYEQNNTLVYRLKHFNSELKGWEEKDEFVEFPLVKLTSNKVYFSGLTMERIHTDAINVYVRIENTNGQEEEVKFAFTRKSL